MQGVLLGALLRLLLGFQQTPQTRLSWSSLCLIVEELRLLEVRELAPRSLGK